MQNKDLRKKVLSTLLTMSCVYLGGTLNTPIVWADMSTDGTTVHGVTKSYSDGSKIAGTNMVIYAGAGEITDITAEGKLKLESTSSTSPVIGAAANGSITFHGNDVTVENINNYANTVVFAESGSNITFNNQTTNIISSTSNSKNFIGGSGNIVFSDTAQTLNIGNMDGSSSISGCIGIQVSGPGSFVFNNTEGIVNIGGFAGTAFDMDGGTIRLEGAETNVNSNSGYLLYLANPAGGLQNKIDFNAQKTTIKGVSQGIYAAHDSQNNNVSFKGIVDIDVQGNGYYQGSAVILASGAGLNLDFAQGAIIKTQQNSLSEHLYGGINLGLGSNLNLKGDIDLTASVVSGGTGSNYGIYSNGGDAVFDGMALTATGGKNIYGIYGWNGGKFTFNKDVSITAEKADASIYGVYLNGNNADFKNLVINANNAEGSNAYGIFARGNSKIKIDGDTVITAAGNNGEFAENSMAIRISDAEVIADGALKAVVSGGETAMGMDIVAIDGSGVFATGTTGMTDISVKNGTEGSYGISLESDAGKKVTADFNNAANITVSGAKDVFGIKGWNSSSGDTEISFKENTVITAQGTERNNSTNSIVSAISLENSGGNITFGKNALVQVTADNKAKNSSGLNLDKGTAVFNGSFTGISVKSNGVNSYGIKNNNSGDVDVMGALVVDVKGQDKVFGIHNANGGKIDIMGITAVNANSESKTAQGIYSTGVNSSIAFKANTILTTNGDNAVQADSGATVVFDKGLVSENDAYIFAHGNNSSIKINNEGGGLVKIIGNLYAQAGGTLDFKMDNSESYLEGFTDGVNMDMQNGATWRVTGNSNSKNLNLENATVDLTADGARSTVLAVADFSGTGGNFIMDTDLASEADGDKINITTANTGTTYVQVKDASLTNGVKVVGHKNLLLITDASENATFVGKSLNAGGLWDVTPTIENGLAVTDADGNVIGTADQWYLTKIAKAVNNDSQVLLDAVDNSYALWRNTNDSLRKRLGELRFRTNETDGDGIWARYTGGKFSGSGFDSSYNMYQLGYDKADNAKSTYGFAIDSGTGHANYAAGGGKDKLMALSVYGTWTGEKGNYTDVVARVGQFDTDVDSYGDYPDKASYKNRAYSLSVEYGKTIELSKERGTFIEPQAQLIMGRLGSSSYTTDRGTAVAVEGMNSAIARLGVVVGKKINDGSDIYFKASALHEFAGERDISMRAANEEVLAGSNDYGDTWFELGLGGNVKLGRASHLYGDIERSFGADIQKKWQINAGVRFEF